MPLALPPAIVSVPPSPSIGRSVDVVTFALADVACSGRPVARDNVVRPLSVVATRFGQSLQASAPTRYRYLFAIGADGRARTIRRSPVDPVGNYNVDTSDLAPSLAASRFPVGAPQTDCSATYTTASTPVAAAPLPVLYELASLPKVAGLPPELWDRVRPAGSDCPREPGQYRRRNLPAFEKIRQAPGTSSWVFLAYDVDRSGRPGNVRVLGSAGNDELDRAGTRALLDNRYAPGRGYRGCTYRFHRSGPSGINSPELPNDTPADPGDVPACSIDPKSIPGLLGGRSDPTAFSHRRIEGVAAVSYDTAPWGAVGNVKVIASEPDAEFGDAARAALSSARVTQNDTGRRNCVRRIRFKLPPS